MSLATLLWVTASLTRTKTKGKVSNSQHNKHESYFKTSVSLLYSEAFYRDVAEHSFFFFLKVFVIMDVMMLMPCDEREVDLCLAGVLPFTHLLSVFWHHHHHHHHYG